MNNLRRIMREAGGEGGEITFARFMELALYCPNFGYYEQPGVSPGRSGDYFTSVSVGSLFGELLAFRLAEWLGQTPAGPRQLVEAGAHDGRLALDIINWLQASQPDLSSSIEYWIIEPSSVRKESQRATLANVAKMVRWFDGWEAIPEPGVNGVIFSNELLDAMPVHRLGWDAGRKEWFEWGVAVGGESLSWTNMPVTAGTLAEGGLLKLPRELLDVLPDGFTTEAGRSAAQWWRQAAGALRSGRLLAIDYGLMAEDFFTPERKEGTLRAYHRHQAGGELLARPGEQDLTAHVNFTILQDAGQAEGLETELLQSQTRFLTEIVKEMVADGKWPGRDVRQFQTLTHPEHLGRAFQVLVQSRPKP